MEWALGVAAAATSTLVVASLVSPPSVEQRRRKFVVIVIGEVVATPLGLVLEELREVKSDWSGLDITQDCMPLVTQPMSEVCPLGTLLGFATSTIEGLLICTAHCAP